MDKLIIAKIRKGNNSVITCDAVDKLIIAKIKKGNNSVITCDGLLFLHSAFSVMGLYQCVKFSLILFYTFRDMLRTKPLLQKLTRAVIREHSLPG